MTWRHPARAFARRLLLLSGVPLRPLPEALSPTDMDRLARMGLAAHRPASESATLVACVRVHCGRQVSIALRAHCGYNEYCIAVGLVRAHYKKYAMLGCYVYEGNNCYKCNRIATHDSMKIRGRTSRAVRKRLIYSYRTLYKHKTVL